MSPERIKKKFTNRSKKNSIDDISAVKEMELKILERLKKDIGDVSLATIDDYYKATSGILADKLKITLEDTRKRYNSPKVKEAAYISIEWLQGQNIHTALKSTKLEAQLTQALKNLGQNPDKVLKKAVDPANGNGGLGRLASCFIDSTANKNLPVTGYGLLYKKGLFFQKISKEGRQLETPQDWYREDNPWIINRDDISYKVKLFKDNPVEIEVVARDMMVPDYNGDSVNTLRLAKVIIPDNFDSGNHEINKNIKAICEHLYPQDNNDAGKNLRLAQEYILVSFSVQDIINKHLKKHKTLDNLAETTSIQINDTHPAMAIPELIRILTKEHGMDWEKAKNITKSVCNYTNHTLLPEALENWQIGKMQYVVPDITDIIEHLHKDLMNEVDEKYADKSEHDRNNIKNRIAINSNNNYRMGHMAAFYSSKVNGVSAMHTELVFKELFPDLTSLRGVGVKINHTNGITPRRWLKEANPALAKLITDRLGSKNWITNLRDIEGLRNHMQDDEFKNYFAAIKKGNKERLATLVKFETGIDLDTDAIFDVQVKRIHEYKRQLMNILQTVALYQEIQENPDVIRPKVVKIIAGKAAPGYEVAKDIIALTNCLSKVINADKKIDGKLKLAFIPNYDVGKAKIITTGADLSEQISTAGKEASGTGNMKFMLNGALTIGTRDGANVEMGDAVGEDNIFFFGKTKEEIDEIKNQGYNPAYYIEKSPRLLKALNFLDEMGFGHLAKTVRHHDEYCIAADF